MNITVNSEVVLCLLQYLLLFVFSVSVIVLCDVFFITVPEALENNRKISTKNTAQRMEKCNSFLYCILLLFVGSTGTVLKIQVGDHCFKLFFKLFDLAGRRCVSRRCVAGARTSLSLRAGCRKCGHGEMSAGPCLSLPAMLPGSHFREVS